MNPRTPKKSAPRSNSVRTTDKKKPGRHDIKKSLPGMLDYNLRIVFEDDTIIVVDKPAGLLSVATPKETQKTVFRILRDYLTFGSWSAGNRRFTEASRHEGAWLGVVHRLDRETSGIMFFVKNDEARQKLTRDWIAKVNDRRYLAVVEGIPPAESGTIRNWLRQNKALRVYELDHEEPDAELAITHYKLIRELEPRLDAEPSPSPSPNQNATPMAKPAAKARPLPANSPHKGDPAQAPLSKADQAAKKNPNAGKRALVELKLETGRTNQIRVHLAGLGCPIVGDHKYGTATGKIRLALHARSISFEHPVTGEIMTFESPVPPEFKRLLKAY